MTQELDYAARYLIEQSVGLERSFDEDHPLYNVPYGDFYQPEQDGVITFFLQLDKLHIDYQDELKSAKLFIKKILRRIDIIPSEPYYENPILDIVKCALGKRNVFYNDWDYPDNVAHNFSHIHNQYYISDFDTTGLQLKIALAYGYKFGEKQ